MIIHTLQEETLAGQMCAVSTVTESMELTTNSSGRRCTSAVAYSAGVCAAGRSLCFWPQLAPPQRLTCHWRVSCVACAHQLGIRPVKFLSRQNSRAFLRYNRGEASDGSLPVNVDVGRKSNAVVRLLSRSALCMAPAPFDSEMSCPAPVLTGLAPIAGRLLLCPTRTRHVRAQSLGQLRRVWNSGGPVAGPPPIWVGRAVVARKRSLNGNFSEVP
jgi:hypothetical protein